MVKMALETFYDSNFHLAALNAGFLQFPTADDSLEEHEQYQASVVSLLNASYGNSPHLNADSIPSYTNPTIGSNARANSLVTDARFAFSEVPNMNGSVTANMGSSINFVEQPALFSSQQTSLLAPKRPQVARKKQQQKGFNAKHQNSLPSGVNQDLINEARRHKKNRLDINEETILGQFIGKQSQETVQLKRNTQKHQLSGLIQHHMLRSGNRLEASQSVPQSHGVIIQPQNQQRSDQLQRQVVRTVCDEQQFNEGLFTHRLRQYIYHLRNRPHDNNIAYWRKFVAEYFAPGATKRWCVSLYDKVGIEATGVIPKSAMYVWQCDMCGCKAGRGFEVIFDSLPRLTKLTFESGVIDELLFLDLPEVCKFPSGLMMLKYGKAVQESVYENFRVVHEGQLNIVFTQELKILSWKFCASCHEVLVPRSLIMSQMVHAAQKYQNGINNSRFNGVSPQDSQATLNQIEAVGCWIANAMEYPVVDDLGFSKSYTRCLQIAEIVQSMKDLMTFSQANQMGPIECFKHYYQEMATPNLQKWEMQEEQHLECKDLSADKFIPAFQFVSTTANDCSGVVNECFTTASEQAASALPGCYNKLAFQGPKTPSSRSTNNFAANGMSSSVRRNQSMEQHMIQKIMQEMIDSRTANEFEKQVTALPARVYNSREVATAHGNALGRTSNSWAAFNMDSLEPAASDTLSMEDRI